MFAGYLYCGNEAFGPKVVAAVAAQGCTMQGSPNGDNVRQLYSRENTAGVATGNHKARSAYCAHIGSCDGVMCSCQNVLTHFLGQTQGDGVSSYVLDNTSYLKENVKFPYLLVLSDGAECFAVTAYAAHDFQVMKLEPGHYNIRDCILSVPADAASVDALHNWSEREADRVDYAEQLVRQLKERLRYYSSHQNSVTLGVVAINDGANSEVLNVCAKMPENEKDGIKGPISQYNYFSMESRKQVREASGAVEMSNNEWNRLVGKRWRELTPREHERYRVMAAQDKKRYETECTAAGLSVEKRVKQTAYNHFVHQEKQFVAATEVTNMKHRTGKYCSARWRAMAADEKQLYLILEQTGTK